MDLILYYVAFLAALCFALLDVRVQSKPTRWALFIPFSLMLAWLAAVTVHAYDIDVYQRIYSRLEQRPEAWAIDLFPEFGFQWVNYIAHGVIGLEFSTFRFVWSAITLLFMFMAQLYTAPRYLGLFFLLYYPKYYLIGVMSHVRSAFVAPGVFLAIKWTAEKRYGLLIVMSLLLSQVHVSALLLLMIPLLRLVPLNVPVVLLALPFSVFLGTVAYPFIWEVLQVLDVRQLNYFTDGDQASASFRVNEFLSIEGLRRIVMLAMCGYLATQQIRQNGYESLTIKVYILSVVVYFGFSASFFISDRVGGLFGIVEPMILIMILDKLDSRGARLMWAVLVLVYATTDFLLRDILLDALPRHFQLW